MLTTAGIARRAASEMWKATPQGQASSVPVATLIHPTQPESSGEGNKAKIAAATKAMLANWNAGMQLLAPAVRHPDQAVPLALYGDSFKEGERPPIPEFDMPAVLPDWMHEQDGWAKRLGKDLLAKRRNITITVPKGVIP